MIAQVQRGQQSAEQEEDGQVDLSDDDSVEIMDDKGKGKAGGGGRAFPESRRDDRNEAMALDAPLPRASLSRSSSARSLCAIFRYDVVPDSQEPESTIPTSRSPSVEILPAPKVVPKVVPKQVIEEITIVEETDDEGDKLIRQPPRKRHSFVLDIQDTLSAPKVIPKQVIDEMVLSETDDEADGTTQQPPRKRHFFFPDVQNTLPAPKVIQKQATEVIVVEETDDENDEPIQQFILPRKRHSFLDVQNSLSLPSSKPFSNSQKRPRQKTPSRTLLEFPPAPRPRSLPFFASAAPPNQPVASTSREPIPAPESFDSTSDADEGTLPSLRHKLPFKYYQSQDEEFIVEEDTDSAYGEEKKIPFYPTTYRRGDTVVFLECRLGEILGEEIAGEAEEKGNRKRAKPLRIINGMTVKVREGRRKAGAGEVGIRALFESNRRNGAVIEGVVSSELVIGNTLRLEDQVFLEEVEAQIAGADITKMSIRRRNVESKDDTLEKLEWVYQMETREAIYEVHLGEGEEEQDGIGSLLLAQLVIRRSLGTRDGLESGLVEALRSTGNALRHPSLTHPLTANHLTESMLDWLAINTSRPYLSHQSYILRHHSFHSVRTQAGVDRDSHPEEPLGIREAHDALLFSDQQNNIAPVVGTAWPKDGSRFEAILFDGASLKKGDFVAMAGTSKPLEKKETNGKGKMEVEKKQNEKGKEKEKVEDDCDEDQVWYAKILDFFCVNGEPWVHVDYFRTVESMDQQDMKVVSMRELFEYDGCDVAPTGSILCRTEVAYVPFATTAIPSTGLSCRYIRTSEGVGYRAATRVSVHSPVCYDYRPTPTKVYLPGDHVYILAEAGGKDRNRVEYRLARIIEYEQTKKAYWINWLVRRDSLPSDGPFRSNRRLVSTPSEYTIPAKLIQGTFLLFSYEALFAGRAMDDPAVRDEALLWLSSFPDVFYHEGEMVVTMAGKGEGALPVENLIREKMETNDDRIEEWRKADADLRERRRKVAASVGGKLVTHELYAGIGGFSQGMKTELGELYPNSEFLCVDSHKPTIDVMKANHGDQPGMEIRHSRIDLLLEAEVDRRAPLLEEVEREEIINGVPLDFLQAGPPCQSFSSNNRFKQDDDIRSNEANVFLNYILLHRPVSGIFENVCDIELYLNADGKSMVVSIEAFLRYLGYETRTGFFACSAYGLPQKRRRVLIMFTLRGTILPRSPLPTHASSVEKLLMARRDVWEVRELATPNALGSAPNPTTTCEDMTSDLPSFGNTGGVKAAQSYASGPMTDFQRLVRRNKNELVTDHQATQHNTLGATRIAQVKINGNYKDIAIDIRPKASGREDDALYGRINRDKPISTVLTAINFYGESQGRKIHPEQNRLLSNRELARAQGFPDSFEFTGVNKEETTRMIGNAVPPPLIAAFIRAFQETWDEEGFTFETGYEIRRKLLLEEMVNRRALKMKRLKRLEEREEEIIAKRSEGLEKLRLAGEAERALRKSLRVGPVAGGGEMFLDLVI